MRSSASRGGTAQLVSLTIPAMPHIVLARSRARGSDRMGCRAGPFRKQADRQRRHVQISRRPAFRVDILENAFYLSFAEADGTGNVLRRHTVIARVQTEIHAVV